MKLVFVPGHLNDPESLLRLPGLLVINDGDFRPEHRDAIRQISLGAKGKRTEPSDGLARA